MSSEWEAHRTEFEPVRPETFDAYVDVWTRDADAARKFADWTTFAECADAGLAKVRAVPDLVRQAEALMARNGYRLGPRVSGEPRRWLHTKGEVRTNSSTAGRTSTSSTRSTRKPAASPRAAATRKPVAPPKPARPTHVECPNDPGMMIPLAGSCMCGWSPSDDNLD